VAHSCGITPTEYWTLTPHEVSLCVQAKGEDLRGWQQLAAWHVAHVLNLFVAEGGEQVTPATLLGRVNTIQSASDWNRFARTQFLRWLGFQDDVVTKDSE
jgi:hypothetical protein